MSSSNIYVIAEAGVNHNGDPMLAKQLVRAAAAAGANAVKFQSFRTESLVTQEAELAEYQSIRETPGSTQFSMLRRLELSREVERELQELSIGCGIEFLSTPFDVPSLKFLVGDLKLSTIKIPSGEITNAPFLLEVARVARRILLSTGGSSLREVQSAISVISYGFHNSTGTPTPRQLRAQPNRQARRVIKDRLSILHAVTAYPAPISDSNLLTIPLLAETFGCTVGLSDHTVGFEAALTAIGLGARIIEKHFTLDQTLPGPDHAASLNVEELAAFVTSIRRASSALGDGTKRAQLSEISNLRSVRRSLVATQPVEEGECFTDQNLGALRPANGRSPFDYWQIVGSRARRSYRRNEPIE